MKRITKAVAIVCLSGFLLINTKTVMSQSYDQAFEKMINVLPTSPNAAALVKYAGVNVNLNKGMVSQGFPLYNLSLKDVAISVGLNYSSDGFKVSEYASRVGYNFTLEAGGVITRTVMSRPDENGATRITYPGATMDSALYKFLTRSVNGSYDAEPDLFSFNFMGYSGKFVIDTNNSIIPIPASNLKFEKDFSSSTWTFKITTPDGNQFYFGGDSATEKTRTESTCGKLYNSYVPTSWYLKKIQTIHGQVIHFYYDEVEFNFYTGVTQSIYYDVDHAVSCFNESQTLQSECPAYPTQNQFCTGILRSKGMFLTQIYVPGISTINFSDSTRPDNDDILYTGFTVLDGNGNTKDNYGFNYADYSDHPFLIAVRKINVTDQSTQITNLVYNDPSGVPLLNTYDQDHWGYYNGKSNASLIPLPFTFSMQQRFPGADADRSPDYIYASKGMLSKIIYPTGGYDTIMYEANDVYEYKQTFPNVSTVFKSVNGTGLFTEVSDQSSNFTISFEQEVKLQFIMEASSSYDPLHNKGSVTLYDVTNSTTIYSEYFEPDGSTHTMLFTLASGTYKIIVTAKGSVCSTLATLYCRIGSAPFQYMNSPTVGVRVKKIISYSPGISVPMIRKFSYRLPSDTDKSSAGEMPAPDYFGEFSSRRTCWVETGGPSYDYCPHQGMYSNSRVPLLLYTGSVSYEAVTELFGENAENGKIEHIYLVEADQQATQVGYGDSYLVGAPLTNTGDLDGKEKQTIIYRNNSGTFVTVKKVTNSYKTESAVTKIIEGVTVNKKHDHTIIYPSLQFNDFEEYDAARYSRISTWVYIDTTTEINYEMDPTNPMTIQTIFQYSNTNHKLITKTISSTSDGGIVEVVMKYPLDYSAITATDTLSEAVKNLQDLYVISPIIEKTTYRKNSNGSNARVIGSTFSLYKDDAVTLKQIWQLEPTAPITDFTPSAVSTGQVTVDSRYQKQVLFEQYDGNGNLLHQLQTADLNKAYIWDYSSYLPIAEVVNAGPSEIAHTSFETSGKGNWTFSGSPVATTTVPTGGKAYLLNGSNNMTKSGLSTGKTYIVSYWIKNTSALSITGTISGYPTSGRTIDGWKYFEHKITGQSTITISGSDSVDEVRLYPANAFMSTNTYDPLLGITSQCDLNNRITYYEYDGFGRLNLIRDQDKYIIKRIEYKYKATAQQ